MSQQIALAGSGNDLSAATENRRIFKQPNFLERGPATRPGFAAQSKELADVGQEQVR